MTLQNPLRGRALVYPRAHINTDEIIPARYLNSADEAFVARHAFEDLDPGFAEKVWPDTGSGTSPKCTAAVCASDTRKPTKVTAPSSCSSS